MTDFSNPHNSAVQTDLDRLCVDLQLSQLKIGPLKAPLTIDFYQNWLSLNYHGDMAYLQHHLEFKKDPKQLNPLIKSVISVAQSYFPAVKPYAAQPPARVALYAHNEDYHHWLKAKLNDVVDQLKIKFPNEVFLPYVDSGPVLERDLAYQNGLGWFGKNTCLIHPQHGSLFFVAEILTSLTDSQITTGFEPLPDFCGKCRKCIDICPTKAIIAPKTLKADLCISYLTIESKTVPPPELRPLMGDWFFGCDLCQTTCPWNEKVFKSKGLTDQPETSTELKLSLTIEKRTALIEYFRFLLTASHKKIARHHIGTPLSRAGAKGLKRNALIVIANQNLNELRPEVSSHLQNELGELAGWALQQLETNKTKSLE